MSNFDCWKFKEFNPDPKEKEQKEQYIPVFSLDRDNYILLPAHKEDFKRYFKNPEEFYKYLLNGKMTEKIDVKYLKVDELGYINIVENSENDKLDKKAEKELRDEIEYVSKGIMNYIKDVLGENNRNAIFLDIDNELRKQIGR